MDDEENNYTEEQLKSFQIEGERALHIVMINRTRPKTCDRVVNLYTLTSKIPERTERNFRCDR